MPGSECDERSSCLIKEQETRFCRGTNETDGPRLASSAELSYGWAVEFDRPLKLVELNNLLNCLEGLFRR